MEPCGSGGGNPNPTTASPPPPGTGHGEIVVAGPLGHGDVWRAGLTRLEGQGRELGQQGRVAGKGETALLQQHLDPPEPSCLEAAVVDTAATVVLRRRRFNS